jgi:hypothetical protein
VKIKLGHYDCETLLSEVLTEFPPESLLQRPGLLEGVLNIVATMFGRGYHGTPLPAVLDYAVCSYMFLLFHVSDQTIGVLSPLSALNWTVDLFEKSVSAFNDLIEGSRCSSIPVSMRAGTDSDNNHEHLDSLASQMAAAVFSNRYPVLYKTPAPEEDIRLLASFGTKKDDILCPPSVSGLAFAILLTALPLLKSKDIAISTVVLRAIRAVIPYIIEPSVCVRADTATTDDNEDAKLMSVVSRKRTQVALNRLETLLASFESGLTIPVLDGSKSAAELSNEAFSWLLVSVTCEVVCAFPLDWFVNTDNNNRKYTREDEDDNDEGEEAEYSSSSNVCVVPLKFGPTTTKYIKDIGIHMKSASSCLLSHTHMIRVSALLKSVDPHFDASLQLANELFDHADNLQAALTGSLFPASAADVSTHTTSSLHHTRGHTQPTMSEREMMSVYHGLVKSVSVSVPLLFESLSTHTHTSMSSPATSNVATIQRQLSIAECVPVLLCASVAYQRYQYSRTHIGPLSASTVDTHIDQQTDLMNVMQSILKFGNVHHKCALIGALVFILCKQTHTMTHDLLDNPQVVELMNHHCVFTHNQQQLLQMLVFRRVVVSAHSDTSDSSPVASLLVSVISSLFACLCTPEFAHCLIVNGIMCEQTHAQAQELRAHTHEYECLHILSLILLDACANYMQSEEGTHTNPDIMSVDTLTHKWLPLLPLLKLIEWNGEQQTHTQTHTQAHTQTQTQTAMPTAGSWCAHITESLYTHMPACKQLTHTLEDVCASSAVNSCHSLWRTVQVLGMSHANVCVRSQCWLALKRELSVSRNLLSASAHTHLLSSDKAGLLLNDPLREFESISCSKHTPTPDTHTNGDIKHTLPHTLKSKRDDTHTNLRKFLHIGFDTHTTIDLSVRCAALAQATHLLTHDECVLLSTAHTPWLLTHVVTPCVRAVHECVWDVSVCSLAEAKFVNVVMGLLKVVICNHVRVRKCLTLCADTHSQADIADMTAAVSSAHTQTHTNTNTSRRRSQQVWNVDGHIHSNTTHTADQAHANTGEDDVCVDILPLVKALYFDIRGTHTHTNTDHTRAADSNADTSVLANFREIRVSILQTLFAVAVECANQSIVCAHTQPTRTQTAASNVECVLVPCDVVMDTQLHTHEECLRTFTDTQVGVGHRTLRVPRCVCECLAYVCAHKDASSASVSPRRHTQAQQSCLSDAFQVCAVVHFHTNTQTHSQQMMLLPSCEMIQQTHNARTHTLTARRVRQLSVDLVAFIASAASNTHMRERLQLTTCFGEILCAHTQSSQSSQSSRTHQDSEGEMFAHTHVGYGEDFYVMLLDANIAHTLRRILHTSPSTEKDCVTLNHTLILTHTLLSRHVCAHTQSRVLLMSEGLQTLAHECWMSVMGPLLPILTHTQSAHTQSAHTQSASTQTISAFSLQRIQYLLVQCLHTLTRLCTLWKQMITSSAHTQTSMELVLSAHTQSSHTHIHELLVAELREHPVSVCLCALIASEHTEKRTRCIAGEVLCECVRTHEAASVIQADMSVIDPRGLYAHTHPRRVGAVDVCAQMSKRLASNKHTTAHTSPTNHRANTHRLLDATTDADTIEQPDNCALTCVLLPTMCLLRVPDSFRGSACVSAALRTLYTLLSCVSVCAHTHEDTATQLQTLIDVCVNSQLVSLLLRLCYDRRTHMRLLSVEVLRVLLSTSAGYRSVCALVCADEGSPSESAHTHMDDVDDTGDEEDTRTNTHKKLSLFTHLAHILSDSSEAPCVRAAILALSFTRLQNHISALVNECAHTPTHTPTHAHDGDQEEGTHTRESLLFCCREVTRLFAVAGELLHLPAHSHAHTHEQTHTTTLSTVRQVVCVLTSFAHFLDSPALTVALMAERKTLSKQQSAHTHVLTLIHGEIARALMHHRILPHLSTLIDDANTHVKECLLTHTLCGARVLLSVCDTDSSEDCAHTSLSSSLSCVGWHAYLRTLTAHMESDYVHTNAYLCQYLLCVSKHYPDVFRMCVQETNGALIVHIVGNMARSYTHFVSAHTQGSDVSATFNSSVCMHVNLLTSLLINKQSSPSTEQANTQGPAMSADSHNHHYMFTHTSAGSADSPSAMIPSQVLQYVANCLHTLIHQLTTFNKTIASMHTHTHAHTQQQQADSTSPVLHTNARIIKHGDDVIRAVSTSFASTTACVSACLRLLAVMVDNPHWRDKLGFDVCAHTPYTSHTHGTVSREVAKSVLCLLADMRTLLHNEQTLSCLSTHNTNAHTESIASMRKQLFAHVVRLVKPLHLSVNTRLDVVMALLANNFPGAARVFAGVSSSSTHVEDVDYVRAHTQSTQQQQSGDDHKEKRESLKATMRFIHDAAAKLHTHVKQNASAVSSKAHKSKLNALKGVVSSPESKLQASPVSVSAAGSPAKRLEKTTVATVGKW